MLIYQIAEVFVHFIQRIDNAILLFGGDLSKTVINYYYDKSLGIDTATSDRLRKTRPLSLCQDAISYKPTDYNLINKILNYLKLNTDDIFIDIGCGTGRVIFSVATQKLKRVVGLEYNRQLVDIANKNLSSLKLNHAPIEILLGDACNFELKDGTVFYMHNPFGRETFTRVTENIKESLILNPREIRIVYYCPVCREVLDNADWLISDGEIDRTGIFVWHNRLN